MPKLKTNKGAAKRFRVTAEGKIKHKKAFKSHILTKKSMNRKRRLRKPNYLADGDIKKVKKMIPYI